MFGYEVWGVDAFLCNFLSIGKDTINIFYSGDVICQNRIVRSDMIYIHTDKTALNEFPIESNLIRTSIHDFPVADDCVRASRKPEETPFLNLTLVTKDA